MAMEIAKVTNNDGGKRSSFALAVGVAVLFGASVLPVRAQHSGRVKMDGSSTVAPITMTAAEMFQKENPHIRVTVGISGTGGGFKKFLESRADLRTDISDASRPIKSSERKKAAQLGVHFVEIPIGLDGIAVMVNPSNHFCEYLTVEELKEIWKPGSTINDWSQVRKGFPHLPIKLYAPTTDNGTFDYFTEAIMGEAKASRSDYMASVTPNVLVQGISGDPGSIGYFAYSYYAANKGKLKLVGVKVGSGSAVKPSLDVIRNGSYKPLSRPLFLYVNVESYKRPEVKAFLRYFLDRAKTIVEHPRVNYVALSDEMYQLDRQRLDGGKIGSAMAKADKGPVDLLSLYRAH